jgi:hypothetical protein
LFWKMHKAAEQTQKTILVLSEDYLKAEFTSRNSATLLWRLDGGVVGVSIDGANFFLAQESPPHGTCGPASAGFTL